MRTVNATLAAAMAAGTGTPIARVSINDGEQAIEAVSYKLTPLTLTAVVNTIFEDVQTFSVIRGVNVDGTEYTVETANFFVRKVVVLYTNPAIPSEGSTMIFGTAAPESKYTITATGVYSDTINDLWEGVDNDKVVLYQNQNLEGTGDPPDAWTGHQMPPLVVGNNVTLSDQMQIIQMIRRLYMVQTVCRDRHATLAPGGVIYVCRYKGILAETPTTYDIRGKHLRYQMDLSVQKAFRVGWTDEIGSTHIEGASGPIINIGLHMLGEMDTPDLYKYPTGTAAAIFPNFAIENGDKVTLQGESFSITLYASIIETYGSGDWTMHITPLDFVQGMSGGYDFIEFQQHIVKKVRKPIWWELPPGGGKPRTGGTPEEPDEAQLNTPSFISTPDGKEIDNTPQAVMERLQSDMADHDHNGGDGAQIAYSSLSGLPMAETQTNNLYRPANSPGGTSAWAGTFTAAGSSGATIKYATSSGTAAAMTPQATTNLGKMRLYNTTRSNSVLISNHVAGTITSTANYPANWVNGDVLTIVSQTVSGGSVPWVDIELTSGPTGKAYMFMNFQVVSATAGDGLYFHPFETYAASKQFFLQVQAANITQTNMYLVKTNSNVFSIGWTGTPTALLIQEAGYLQ